MADYKIITESTADLPDEIYNDINPRTEPW